MLLLVVRSRACRGAEACVGAVGCRRVARVNLRHNDMCPWRVLISVSLPAVPALGAVGACPACLEGTRREGTRREGTRREWTRREGTRREPSRGEPGRGEPGRGGGVPLAGTRVVYPRVVCPPAVNVGTSLVADPDEVGACPRRSRGLPSAKSGPALGEVGAGTRVVYPRVVVWPSAHSGPALGAVGTNHPKFPLDFHQPQAILTPAVSLYVRTSRCSDEPAGPQSLRLSLLSKDGRSTTRKAISWPRRVYEGHPKSSEPQGTGRQSVFPCLAGH